MFKRLLITLIILLMTSSFVLAVDDQGNENDPNTNDRANACYEGGTMENRCETELDWQAGWYLIRFEYNLISRDEVPSWVVWVLPPEFTPEELTSIFPVPSAGCLQISIAPMQSVNFAGGYFIPAGATLYLSADCTGITDVLSAAVVFAPAPFDPLTLCNRNGTFASAFAAPNDVYACNI